jgi:hypothetical protein
MTSGHNSTISPHHPREFSFVILSLMNQRAQGMPGARCARSLACDKKTKHTSVVTTVTPVSPGIPRAMVLTAYSALSPVTGLSCHRRLQVITCQLDTSVGVSGPHDFAVREMRPRLWRHPRPPHPVPNVRDDRETPLERRTGREGYRCDLGRRRSEMFFSKGLDSRIHLASHFADLPAGQVGMRSRPPNGPAGPDSSVR